MDTRKLILSARILGAAKEKELAQRVEAGVYAQHLLDTNDKRHATEELMRLVSRGREAGWTLIESNLRLVMKLAGEISNRYKVSMDDLFQEGCVALTQAFWRYDYERNTRFSTWAYDWILRRLQHASSTHCGSLDLVRRKDGTRQVVKSYALEQVPAHLLTVEAGFEKVEQESLQFLDLLGEDAVVLRLRFGIGTRRLTRNQTAVALGLSASTIQRIESRALQQARQLLSAERIRVSPLPSPRHVLREPLAA